MRTIWATSAVCLLVAGGCGSSSAHKPSRGLEGGQCDYVAAMIDPTPQPDIELRLEARDLQQIYEQNLSVGLGRAADSTAPSNATVLWTSFRPLLVDEITWAPDDVGAYASTTQPQPGATIILLSLKPKALGTAVRYDPHGFFTESGPAPKGTVDISVARGEGFVPALVGVSASVSVNGRTLRDLPFSAAGVAQGGSARMTPASRVWLFLTREDSGVILRALPPDALQIDLTNGNHVVVTRCSSRFVVLQQA